MNKYKIDDTGFYCAERHNQCPLDRYWCEAFIAEIISSESVIEGK